MNKLAIPIQPFPRDNSIWLALPPGWRIQLLLVDVFERKWLIQGPVELIRIRLQTQSGKNKQYTGPIDCIRKIYKAGGIRALYRGMGPTVGREGHGMG